MMSRQLFTSNLFRLSGSLVIFFLLSINVFSAEEAKKIKGPIIITSEEATYYADGEKVIFTGEPQAIDGENVVTGKKMTYLLNEDLFLVENSKVFLTKKKEH